jgi:hypothetical protein
VLVMNADMIGALLKNDMGGFSAAARQALADQNLATEAARAATGLTTVDEAMRIGLRSIS